MIKKFPLGGGGYGVDTVGEAVSLSIPINSTNAGLQCSIDNSSLQGTRASRESPDFATPPNQSPRFQPERVQQTIVIRDDVPQASSVMRSPREAKIVKQEKEQKASRLNQ